MHVVISHKSAMQYWRRFRGEVANLPRLKSTHAMERPVPLTPELLAELAGLGFAPAPDSPLDLLFSAAGARSRSQLVRSRCVTSPLPAGSLMQLSDHVAIVSPELCFSQMASMYSRGQLLMAGCELCGTYRLLGDDGRPLPKPEERSPLTSAAKLCDFARVMGLGRGAKAVIAAHHVFGNAASPMEARAALLMSLPQTMGGFGLPRPELNAPITLSRAAHRVYPCNPCRMDLYWRAANLDVEYDGGDHTEERRERDSARILALRMEGVDVLVLMKQQVYDVRAMASVAKMVAVKLGRRLRISTRDFESRHLQLRRELGLKPARGGPR